MNRALRIGDKMVIDNHIDLKVQGHIVFVNPTARIVIKDSPPIHVVTFDELQQWLSQISLQFQPLQNSHFENTLWRYQVPMYQLEQKCSEERMLTMKKGFHCKHCDSFAVKMKRFKLACNCGQEEAKESAYTRTVCEYGTLMHHKSLTRRDLIKFLGKQANEEYLKKILRKHFQLEKGSTKGCCYINKGVPFEEWFQAETSYFEKIESRIQWRQ